VVTVDRQPLPHPTAGQVTRELTVDLLDDAAVERSSATSAELSALQHVIGIPGGGDAAELGQPDPATASLGVFSRVVANNPYTAFVTVRHAVPLLRRSVGDRYITLVGSINAFGGYGAPGYSAVLGNGQTLIR
jgi:NAD(P)-dependent dehydrogenase (short-subunit alcohol dehydrogenase family)